MMSLFAPGSVFRSRLLPALGLCLLVLTGIGTRRAFVVTQRGGGAYLPFTLESALHYRRIREAFLGNGIPVHDRMIQVPEGIQTFETDTVGSELVVARIARWMPGLMTLTERVRWIHVVWFCTGIAWLALWVRWRTTSWGAAWFAGFFYAVSMSAVSRSTGGELSHENVALPFLLAHLAWDARSVLAHGQGTRIAARVASILCLCLALATWDMIQFYVGLRAFAVLLDAVRGRRTPETSVKVWGPEWAALMLLGVFHPYLRAHQFYLSPALGMMAVAGLFTLASHLSRFRAGRLWPVLTAAGVALAIVPAKLSGYAAAYGHFGRLLYAKIRFLNIKPPDPSLLDFDQRMMWTPALHSATVHMARDLFPALLILTIALYGVHFLATSTFGPGSKGREVEVPEDRRLFFYTLFSVLFFILFVRFHVYAALFLCASIGMLLGSRFRRRGVPSLALSLVLALAVAVEAGNTVWKVGRWGRTAPFEELKEVAGWMREHVRGEPVLANFGLSAYLLTYADTPILLHPKFETAVIRTRVEDYADLLFRGTEGRFADWALAQGAHLFVYGRGEFAKTQPEYQLRYIANALVPPMDAPARQFEWAPWRLSRFEPLWGNGRYTVFRILPPPDGPGSGGAP